MKGFKTLFKALVWFISLLLIAYSIFIYASGPDFSKLFAGFLGGVFILFILFWELLKKLDKKIFKYFYIIILSLFLTSFIVIEGLIIKSGNDHELSNMDAIIVLGAGLKDGLRPHVMLSHRLNAAYKIMIENPKIICIVSGGQGKDELVSEAQAMATYLKEKGIDSNKIILEDKSTSTYENLLFSRHLLEKDKIDLNKVAYITNDYHVFRAGLIARRLGCQFKGISAEGIDYLAVNYYIREYFGVVKHLLLGE